MMLELVLGGLLLIGAGLISFAAVQGLRSARRADIEFAGRARELLKARAQGRIDTQSFLDQQVSLHRQLCLARSLSPRLQRGLAAGVILTVTGAGALVFLKVGRTHADTPSASAPRVWLADATLPWRTGAGIGSGGTGGGNAAVGRSAPPLPRLRFVSN